MIFEDIAGFGKQHCEWTPDQRFACPGSHRSIVSKVIQWTVRAAVAVAPGRIVPDSTTLSLILRKRASAVSKDGPLAPNSWLIL
jgi:hypothetical protein